jgi:hypothetical protein
MNPFDLSATGLMMWGLVAHLIADWPLQNDWMASFKANRRYRHRVGDGMIMPPGRPYTTDAWWDRHPAAYVHAGIHGLLLALVFGWVAAPLALAHLLIDTRWPVAKWSKLVGQTQPQGNVVNVGYLDDEHDEILRVVLYDIGTEVRFWTDQVFHIATIAAAALLVSL